MKTLKPFLLLLALAGSCPAAEKPLQTHFEQFCPIGGTFQSGQRGRIALPDIIFDQSVDFPYDLRIIDANGTQWPYFLYTPAVKNEVPHPDPEILNKSFVTNPAHYLQFDLLIPEIDGATPVHNQLEFETTGRDFVRRVEIFTGSDPDAGHMASGYLINFARKRNAQTRIIRYPNSDAARLHVRIYANAQAADETFELTAAHVRLRSTATIDYETVSFKSIEAPEREQEENAQTQLLDIEAQNRPVEQITFDVANDSFTRCVSIFGRNTEHDPWKWVGGGEIHALTDDTATSIKLNAKSRFLKIHVFHYDDPPLTINKITLEATPRYLIFEAATDGSAALYFRSWDSTAPRYDLKKRMGDKNLLALPLHKTRAAQPNENANPQPLRKYLKSISAIAVAVVSLLVIWVIVSMLHQQKDHLPKHDQGKK